MVGSIYRSATSTKANNKLLLDEIAKANDIAGDNRLLILGDLNVPYINWSNRELTDKARDIEVYTLDVINDCFLYQHVDKSTRFRNNESSLLDLILTREELDVMNIEVFHPLGKSDHGVVMADFICEWKTRVEQKPRRIYSKGNYAKIMEGLEQTD